MKFDFTKVPGIDAELAEKLNGDDAAQGAIADQAKAQAEDGINERIEEAVKNRTEVAVADLKKKADGFDTKRKALEADLKTAQDALAAAPKIEPEELEALAKFRDENPELKKAADEARAARETAEKSLADRNAELERQSAELSNERRDGTLRSAISEYNRANPTTALRPDMEDLAMMLGRDAVRYDDEAKAFRVYGKDGTVVSTDNGAATAVDWIGMLRTERGSMFTEPQGAGAPGSQPPAGGGGKTMTRTEFNKITDPAAKATAARSHQIVDG